MEHIKISRADDVLTVSLNRPEKRNAFFPAMIREITSVFRATAKDRPLRTVVLTGEGKSFCSGGDLEWMRSMASFTYKQNLRDAEELFAMYAAIRACPVPVVGRVFGHCFGGGAGLVAVCDVVFASPETAFCFSEVKWGLAPAVISPFVIERALPAKVAEWFLTAKMFDAPEALAGGLINSIQPQMFSDTLATLRAAAPEAVRATKKLQRSYSSIKWAQVRPRVTKLIAERRVSDEGQKGLKAFLSKTTPTWGTP